MKLLCSGGFHEVEHGFCSFACLLPRLFLMDTQTIRGSNCGFGIAGCHIFTILHKLLSKPMQGRKITTTLSQCNIPEFLFALEPHDYILIY